MSGGHWDYENLNAVDKLSSILHDCKMRQELPLFCKLAQDLVDLVGDVLYDCDYHICGDSKIVDFEGNDKEAQTAYYGMCSSEYKENQTPHSDFMLAKVLIPNNS